MTEAEEIEGIAAALDALLDAILEDRERRPRDWSVPMSAGDVIRRMQGRADQTDAQRAADGLIEDPVGVALRRAVVTLGERLHELGGLPLMGKTSALVAELKPDTGDNRESILDHYWSGIGDWMA